MLVFSENCSIILPDDVIMSPHAEFLEGENLVSQIKKILNYL